MAIIRIRSRIGFAFSRANNVEDETYYVLFDPIQKRYFSDGAIGRVFARAARPFMEQQSAVNQRDSWWQNKRFSEVRKITLKIEGV